VPDLEQRADVLEDEENVPFGDSLAAELTGSCPSAYPGTGCCLRHRARKNSPSASDLGT
jgi:hypothetical protein